jgi:hypothetical protein
MSSPALIERLFQTATFLWMVFSLVWIVRALRTKRTIRTQSSASQLLYTAILVFGVYLIFAQQSGISWLDRQLLPVTVTVAVAGLLAVLTGAAFSIWTRFMLGGNWSNRLTVKEVTRSCTPVPIALSATPSTAASCWDARFGAPAR